MESTLVTLDHLECQGVHRDGPKSSGGQGSALPCSWHRVVPPLAHPWTPTACMDVVVGSVHGVVVSMQHLREFFESRKILLQAIYYLLSVLLRTYQEHCMDLLDKFLIRPSRVLPSTPVQY